MLLRACNTELVALQPVTADDIFSADATTERDVELLFRKPGALGIKLKPDKAKSLHAVQSVHAEGQAMDWCTLVRAAPPPRAPPLSLSLSLSSRGRPWTGVRWCVQRHLLARRLSLSLPLSLLEGQAMDWCTLVRAAPPPRAPPLSLSPSLSPRGAGHGLVRAAPPLFGTGSGPAR
jgi:hypothetical protein